MKSVVILLILSFSFLAQAEMSKSARNLLIDKFEKLSTQLPPGDENRTGIVLRLADLLSERARQASFAELESGCVKCNAGENDRKRALSFYRESLPKLNSRQKSKVLSQMGHLYQMQGQQDKAVELYKQVITSEKSAVSRAEAHLSLAEVYFKKRLFASAIPHYKKVMATDGATRKSLAAYRLAWSEFNLGQVQTAIDGLVHILKTPKLLNRGNQHIVTVDEQYQAEVARDLATFMAKNKADLDEAKLLYNLSPQGEKLNQVAYLASELQRMGEVSGAISVYRFVIDKESNRNKRLGYYIHLAQLEKNLNQTESALSDYQQALRLWTSLELCTSAECGEWKSRLRKFTLDWHHSEKNRPSDNLLSAYNMYNEAFPNEVDMKLWKLQIYEQRKDYHKLLSVYKDVANRTKAGTAVKGQNNKDDLPSFEDLLLLQVETAEKMADNEIRTKTYKSYLEQSVDKTKEFEIRYQLAHLDYKDEKYQIAADQFRNLALNKSADNKIRTKSADLALDALAILKKDAAIEKWASEFAGVFAKRSSEFSDIARKSVLNQAAKLADNNDLASWDTLSRVNLQGSSESDKITYYKNRLILAEKLKKYAEAREAAEQLLSFKELVPADRQFALSRKAWLAELSLDFKTAYAATKKLKLKELKPAQKSLKLAILAELAGQEHQTFYQSYLQQTQDREQAFAIAQKLVESSKDKIKAIKNYRKYLIEKPKLYAAMYFNEAAELEGPKQSSEFKQFLADKVANGTTQGQLIKRLNFITSVESLSDTMQKHQLQHKTQRQLSRSLSARVKLLEKADALLKQAATTDDWTSQVLAINLLAKESSRFYEEILSLPMPDSLTENEQMQYMTLLSQQAAPHQIRSEELSKKLAEYWSNDSIVQQYQESLTGQTTAVANLIMREIRAVASIAPENTKLALNSLKSNPEKLAKLKPNLRELENLRNQLRKQPFNKDLIAKLLEKEKTIGNTAMVAYLQSRLNSPGDN